MQTYRAVANAVGTEALHELIARRGPEVLAMGVPFLIRACRWRAVDHARRTRRELPIDEVTDPLLLVAFDSVYESALAGERHRALAEALADMQDRDVLNLWGRAHGATDEEIAAALSGGEPVSIDTVRQRRLRAIKHLRMLLRDR